jgi:DNA helicase-2/ATP-dependent DNA helicase PcrA
MQLTDSQKQAVEQNEGPLLIIAGAGTGKTTVLIEKIKYLIQNKLAKPEEILALTFTDKACREIEERVDRALPLGYNQLNIATFHSFSDTILRDEAAQIGLSPAYKLQTTAQQVYFLRKHLFELELNYFRPLGNPTKFLEGLLQHFSRLRDEDVTPEEYLKWTEIRSQKSEVKTEEEKIEKEKYQELANAYKKFQELKIRENVMDFADLIFYAVRLFKKRSNVTVQYKNKFKYILVDEFQDTNIAQYELIKLLAPPDSTHLKKAGGPTGGGPAGFESSEASEKRWDEGGTGPAKIGAPILTVIGDDNQSIYKFRGASVSNILKFMEDYPSAGKVILLENFRSNQNP